ELLKDLEVTVVAAILVDGEKSLVLAGEAHKGQGFSHSRSQGLVDYDVAARGYHSVSKFVVGFVGRSHDYEANLRHCQHLVDGADDADVRIRFGSFRPAALDDSSKAQAWHGANDWGVKGAPRQAKPDQPHSNLIPSVSHAASSRDTED